MRSEQCSFPAHHQVSSALLALARPCLRDSSLDIGITFLLSGILGLTQHTICGVEVVILEVSWVNPMA